jgi:ubiquinone/menaquinone biosynthesis C-methylase UbiE
MSEVKYFAESEHEGERLKRKTDLNLTYRQLLEADIDDLKNNSKIMDMGAGVGIISNCIENIMTNNNIQHHLFSVDYSFQRINASNLHKSNNINITNLVADTLTIPLKNNVIDFTFSRFLFEYLPNPQQALNEIVKVTKPGGKVVISDLDFNCLCYYPISNELQEQFDIIARVLYEKKLFDAFVGRKLYSYFVASGLKNIKTRIEGYNILQGELSETIIKNWEMKVNYICDGPKKFGVEYGFDIEKFRKEFKILLRNPLRFSYTPLITVEGIKP